MLHRGSKEYTLWSIGLLIVIVFSLFPVLWLLSLSLKAPATISDQRLIPSDFTFENYTSLFAGEVGS